MNKIDRMSVCAGLLQAVSDPVEPTALTNGESETITPREQVNPTWKDEGRMKDEYGRHPEATTVILDPLVGAPPSFLHENHS